MSLNHVPGDALPPGLVKESIYYCNVSKKQVSSVIEIMRKLVPPRSVDMQHIKRVQPVANDNTKLSVMLCFTYCCGYDKLKDALMPLLKEEFDIQVTEAAKYPARTKEEAAEWCSKVWPVMWRGNVSAVPPKIEVEEQKLVLERCAQFKEKPDSSACCDTCIIVDPTTNEIKGSSSNAEKNSPLDHDVMQAIRAVSKTSSASSDMYLCVGLDVYCSQEPCIMCCMALVHSRIGRLIYKDNSKDTKSSIRHFKLHGRAQLNHTFEAWKYTPAEETELTIQYTN